MAFLDSRRNEVAAIRFLLEREDLAGVFNLTAPELLTMKDFARKLGRALKRPAWIPVPAALLKAGFRFSYPDLEEALCAILRS
jgi:NAD dependent epimerase/dehydratase family enzyme